MRKILLCIFALFLSACSFSQKEINPPSVKFILNSDELLATETLTQTHYKIKILMPQSPLYLQSNQIYYLKKNELNSYAFHMWESPLTMSYYSFMTHKLQNSGIFEAVINKNSLISPDYILESRMDNFEQVFDDNDNFVWLKMSVSLIRAQDKTLLGQRFFDYRTEVDNQNIQSVVAAFDKTLNSLSNDLVVWISELLKKE
ncbi:ABC-type transport auxiliary lipoprotein family protein [Campylobacter sp. CCS1377]|uniref:ABC-type transport auxiliary lipoprotein family protein n=1 Tax=Campylobacter sp. CCS1377 TaxID=3158229 RepID=A0AAU7E6K4_9BACT|nr:ABC-type transport auxiliary lipoprotein family protein [Campylobacter jejuni]